ncbi:PRTRC system ThiF family protein [Mucilaginibacter sp. SJ]|uniref:PRTRC system ThiF family protein n=1 Tax=Mucilaginibacter sp. SJ TaxID=3029053 RepID=UPI0023A9ACC9|nr:PRTRC system ThiF family protein [Mucilaginibacter sp. SJ]WEA00702.1 PRTRC system ThiF family protein [Mucilaginibacter sp. SJ]
MNKKINTTRKIPVHIVDPELLQPFNPVMVNLIGAGGTGSHVLTGLMRLSFMLNELGHPGLHVRLFDDDIIEHNNRLRMLFNDAEVGLHKSVVLINRINRAFGLNWKAVTDKFDNQLVKELPEMAMAAITITAVDSVSARFEIAAILGMVYKYASHSRNKPRYWMDFGNSRDSGQVILSTVGEVKQPESARYETRSVLRMVTDEFPDLLSAGAEKDAGHNCSTASALEEQDLFINASLAYPGVEILNRMFREGMVFDRGFFYNLKDHRMHPLKVA